MRTKNRERMCNAWILTFGPTGCRDLRNYLEGRSDIESRGFLSTAKFSQAFAKRIVLLHHQRSAAHQPSPAHSRSTDEEQNTLSDILMQRGELNFESSRSGMVSIQANSEQEAAEAANRASALKAQMEADERLARQLQAEENSRAGLPGGWVSGEFHAEGSWDDEDDDDDDSDDSSGSFYERTLGGWRMRESQHQEEVANDEDVSCLEVKKVVDAEGHCPVCQELWSEGDEQRVLPCGHGFHPAW
jgi:hypothetical protein